ncbi:Uncharacterised protein [Salmonella enterica subsp. enterica serovar Typhimurium str. DT104]|nr:Uncharacterised protein [Salmonella enterica subsp. enterica serovar Typhimurium str. DT104]
MVSAECARGCIPKQCIIGERGDGVAQTVDIGGVGGDISGVLIDAGRIGGDIGCVLVNAVGISGNIGSVLVDAAGIGGDISSVLIHFLICIKQLRAVNGIGAVRSQGTRRQIGDFAVASVVLSAECARGCIPQQGIIGERGDGIAQVVDIGGVGGNISGVLIDAVGIGGDISGVLRHIFVGGKQLGAVHRIGAVRGQGARRQIGDLAGASATAGAECARGCIP